LRIPVLMGEPPLRITALLNYSVFPRRKRHIEL